MTSPDRARCTHTAGGTSRHTPVRLGGVMQSITVPWPKDSPSHRPRPSLPFSRSHSVIHSQASCHVSYRLGMSSRACSAVSSLSSLMTSAPQLSPAAAEAISSHRLTPTWSSSVVVPSSFPDDVQIRGTRRGAALAAVAPSPPSSDQSLCCSRWQSPVSSQSVAVSSYVLGSPSMTARFSGVHPLTPPNPQGCWSNGATAPSAPSAWHA